MALRERSKKTRARGAVKSYLRAISNHTLTAQQRGAIYVAIFLIALWWLFRPSPPAETSSPGVLRSTATRLSSGISDEDIYGPPVPMRKQQRSLVTQSTLDPLQFWNGHVPETILHGNRGGWTVMDGVVVYNGTLYIVSDDRFRFPELNLMFSSGVEMSNEEATWASRPPKDAHIQVVTSAQALERFGKYATVIPGTTFWCNDSPQFASHYYHFVGEIMFGLWRSYSMLDLQMLPNGTTSLSPPQRIWFPHIPRPRFKDYSRLTEFVSKAVFPSMAFEFEDSFVDRNDTKRPFLLPRVVVSDRISTELGKDWPDLYKYIAPAFHLPGPTTGGSGTFWAPIRRALLDFLGGDEILPPRGKTVITYVSRQDWSRRMLNDDDDAALQSALQKLGRDHGYEVNVVHMDKLTPREQLILALRTTVMLGVHGNGLTHAVWMEPSRRPVLFEFFADQQYSSDYEYPMRVLGVDYYAWWQKAHFSHRNLPKIQVGSNFHSNNIRIDGNAVAKLVHAHVTNTVKG